MRTTKPNRLLFLFMLALVVFFFTRHTSAHSPGVCREEATELHQAVGTQRLWESLSHQFVSIKAY